MEGMRLRKVLLVETRTVQRKSPVEGNRERKFEGQTLLAVGLESTIMQYTLLLTRFQKCVRPAWVGLAAGRDPRLLGGSPTLRS